MINSLHQFIYKIKNKLLRERRKQNLKKVPFQKNNFIKNLDNKLFDPIIYTPKYISEEMSLTSYNQEIFEILNNQKDEPYLNFLKEFYQEISIKHKTKSSYVDLIKVLHVISKLIKPESYLEIGVRRGRSMSIVARNSPNCDLYAFDMWIKNYTGVDNPGQKFVEDELKKVNHFGSVKFFNGDSKLTIPKFKKDYPNNYFDIICVDGDHSYLGASTDLKNVLEIIKIGGFLIFDDTNSFEHPFLKNVWKKNVKNKSNFITKEFNEHGLGVSIAVRIF